MEITNEILNAISRAADHYGNVSMLARKMGIAHSTILFWRSGKTAHISGKLWVEKIRPVLAPFLQQSEIVAHDPLASYGEKTLETDIVQQQITLRQASIIRIADLLNFDPALESIAKFVREYGSGKHAFFHICKSGSFAFRAGDIENSGLPADSYLLTSRSTPTSGSVVILRLRDSDSIRLCRYFRDGNDIRIEPFSGIGETLHWNCQTQQGLIHWIYPILEVNMDLDPAKDQETGEEDAE